MAVNPTTTPTYTRHAIFPRAKDIVGRLADKPKRVSELIGKPDDLQVVYRITKQKNVSYDVVHRLFTHCLHQLGPIPELSRAEAILPVQDGKSPPPPQQDPALADCRVFLRLPALLTEAGLDRDSLSRAASIGPAHIEHMIAGRPVSTNVVEAAFEHLQKLLPHLDHDSEIFR